MRERKDLSNQRFGRLIAIKRAPNDKRNRSTWLCLCDCGVISIVQSAKLGSKHTRSCGCLAMETKYKHGLRLSNSPSLPEYNSWDGMIQRCHNPKNPSYHNYGGRGISVCNEWKASFKAFFEYMGRKPSPKHSIDRIDNDKGYEPANCRWATRHVQNCNTRRCRKSG